MFNVRDYKLSHKAVAGEKLNLSICRYMITRGKKDVTERRIRVFLPSRMNPGYAAKLRDRKIPGMQGLRVSSRECILHIRFPNRFPLSRVRSLARDSGHDRRSHNGILQKLRANRPYGRGPRPRGKHCSYRTNRSR